MIPLLCTSSIGKQLLKILRKLSLIINMIIKCSVDSSRWNTHTHDKSGIIIFRNILSSLLKEILLWMHVSTHEGHVNY